MPVNVPLTNNAPNQSRHDLLNWVNETISAHYVKIEDLRSGAAYCKLIELLFPGTICMKKVKPEAKLDHECIHNLKIFQNALTKLDIDKSVPIDRLVKGRFQDNFEFIQWFKKFYDLNWSNKENHNAVVKYCCQAASRKSKSPKKINPDTTIVPSTIDEISKTCANIIPMRRSLISSTPKPEMLTSEKSKQNERIPPKSMFMLSAHLNQFKEKVEVLEAKRSFYYEKLRNIEILIQEEQEKGPISELLQKIQEILCRPYAVPISDENN